MEENKKEIIVYKNYSYFDQSWEAKYMRRERLKYKESFLTEYEKELVERNKKWMEQIFSKFMPELLRNLYRVI